MDKEGNIYEMDARPMMAGELRQKLDNGSLEGSILKEKQIIRENMRILLITMAMSLNLAEKRLSLWQIYLQRMIRARLLQRII